MENLFNAFTTPLLLSGIIFVIVSLLLLKFPPKEINSFYGYRTSTSMETQEQWDFAQRYSSIMMLKCGIGMILISLIGPFLTGVDAAFLSISAIVVLLLPVAILFYKTEKAIKNKFK